MLRASYVAAASAAGGGSPGGQGEPGNNDAIFGSAMNFGSQNSAWRPRTDTPKALQPDPYTGEFKDGMKQDAKNFCTDVDAYIVHTDGYQTNAKKIRFLIGYFRGPFSNEWKARVERGEMTPGFNDSDDVQMDGVRCKEWFLKHIQDLGASIRHRTEFLNYTGRGVPIDQVLQTLQMLQQQCN
jgi:hypothetical protein